MERLFENNDQTWTERGRDISDSANTALRRLFEENSDLSPREVSHILIHEVLVLELDEILRRNGNV